MRGIFVGPARALSNPALLGSTAKRGMRQRSNKWVCQGGGAIAGLRAKGSRAGARGHRGRRLDRAGARDGRSAAGPLTGRNTKVGLSRSKLSGLSKRKTLCELKKLFGRDSIHDGSG